MASSMAGASDRPIVRSDAPLFSAAVLSLSTADDAARLLNAAGARLAEHVRFAQIEPGRWYALFGRGGSYQLEWSEDWGRLMLIAELGFPSPEGQRQALNLALSYNALWREVGNLRMAREGTDGELILIGELGPEEAEPEAFDAALLHFEGLRRWWGGVLTHPGGGLPPVPAPPAPWVERI